MAQRPTRVVTPAMRVLLLLLLLLRSAGGLNLSLSRRDALRLVASSPLATLASSYNPAAASAAAADSPERSALLTAISSGSDDSAVLSALESLVPLDPSGGRGASSPDLLDGEWTLLWSARAEAFSPLLRLPPPFRPSSYQYLGSAASSEVGPGRVAQGLTGGILGDYQMWLSSGVAPSPSDASVLDVLPPFRLQLGGRAGSGRPKRTVVEAGSDAEFRAANARTVEAQRAPPNRYRQLYVEDGPGAIRVSTVAEGDPVIVGAIFVHRKL